MNLKEFKEFIKKNKESKFTIKIHGFISLNLYSKITHIIINKEEINLLCNKESILKINRHQIMKIELIENNIVKIKLDELLVIYINKDKI